MSYRDHAIAELKAIGYKADGTDEEPNNWVVLNVLELLDVFSEQAHSGSSAPHVVSLFEKLALFKPLAPLQGTDSEWCEVSKGLQQNRRCSHVFKENGQAYDIDGIIWKDRNGCTYTNGKSRVPVTFPYTPKSEVRNVE